MQLSCKQMELSVLAVERILSYNFKNKKLLEEALTHSSFTLSPSYERLEFLGDAALNNAISTHSFLAYPDLDPGQLSLLRSANVSTEKFARVAVRHGLYQYVRRNAAALDEKVLEFIDSVGIEDGLFVYGGLLKAPKVLADIVESVAGAVYEDANFDLQKLWVIFRGLLEPIFTPEDLKGEPQPVSLLFKVCQKHGLQVDIKHWRKGSKSIAGVCVDGRLIASGSGNHQAIARLDAARVALAKLSADMSVDIDAPTAIAGIAEAFEIEDAKQKLHNFCLKKKWPKPTYGTEKDSGPSQVKRFQCYVRVATSSGVFQMNGDEKSRIRDAENSAASLMIHALQVCCIHHNCCVRHNSLCETKVHTVACRFMMHALNEEMLNGRAGEFFAP